MRDSVPLAARVLLDDDRSGSAGCAKG